MTVEHKKWKKVEPLLRKLTTGSTENPEAVTAELSVLADEFFPDLSMPKMLSESEVMERLPELRKMVAAYVTQTASSRIPPKDGKQYIWEEVMTMFYGGNFFGWFNKVVR